MIQLLALAALIAFGASRPKRSTYQAPPAPPEPEDDRRTSGWHPPPGAAIPIEDVPIDRDRPKVDTDSASPDLLEAVAQVTASHHFEQES